MLNSFADWLEQQLPPGYLVAIGPWQDDASAAGSFFAAIRQLPAGAPVVGVRRVRYHVTLLGPRHGRQHQLALMADAQALAVQAIERSATPCGAAHITVMGEAQGPGITAEGRPWAALDFELIY